MDFEKLFQEIGLAEEGIETFYTIHKRSQDPVFEAAMEKAYAAFDESDEAFAAYLDTFAAQEDLAVEVLNLYIYLRLCERTLAIYRQRGIEDAVFYETAQDITLSCRYLVERTGVYGISVRPHRNWLRHFFNIEIFRFGRLQFELISSKWDVEIAGHQVHIGDTILSTHIPRYAKFSDALCEESYARAREFFKKHFGIKTCVFFCASWLLHPWLSEALTSDSSIVKFQSKYTIIELREDPGEVGAMIRNIFLSECDNIDDYPEDTSLQRIVKEKLRRGDPMGAAAGIRL